VARFRPEVLSQRLRFATQRAMYGAARHPEVVGRVPKSQVAAAVAFGSVAVAAADWPSPSLSAAGSLRKTVCQNSFVSSGLAACFSSLAVQPIDLIHARVQVDRNGGGAIRVASRLFAAEGTRGFYSGVTAALTRQASYGTTRLGLYRYACDRGQEKYGGHLPFVVKALFSIVAGAGGVMVGNPFDVALVRMQTDTLRPVAERRNYSGVVDAVSSVTRKEGVVALWRGCTVNIARASAMNLGMMAAYDQIKETLEETRLGKCKRTTILASFMAAVSCSFTTMPFDCVKTRLQTMTVDPVTKQAQYDGVLDAFCKIAKEPAGIPGFWRGYGAFATRCGPHAVITILAMEAIRGMA